MVHGAMPDTSTLLVGVAMENWPDPPLIETLLLEDQVFYVVAALIAVAIVIYVVSGRRQMPGLRRATAVPVALAIGVATVASMYETEREQMVLATKQMVFDATAQPFDIQRLESWMAQHFSMTAGKENFDRKRLLHEAERVLGSGGYTVKDYWIHDLRAHQETGESGTGLTYLVVTIQSDGGTAKTRWMLRWELNADHQWMLAEAEMLKFNGQDPERIFSFF